MEGEALKLDKYDRGILWHLDVNSRYTHAEIARAVRLSKQAVGYRIKKLEEAGLIRGYRTLINLSSLGYVYCRLHIKFFNTGRAEEAAMIEAIAKNEKVNWVVSTDGPHDLLVALIGNNEMEVEKTVGDILAPHRDRILGYDFATIVRLSYFNRGYWLGRKSPEQGYIVGAETPYVKQKSVTLDQSDREILGELAGNARASISAIATKAGLSPETVSYRIRKLEENGVIGKYFLLLDYKKTGTQLYKTLLYVNPMEEKKEKELATVIAMNPYIIDYVKTLAPWQMELDLEARDNAHYHEIIADIMDRFKGQIRDYQTLYVLREHKFNYFPI